MSKISRHALDQAVQQYAAEYSRRVVVTARELAARPTSKGSAAPLASVRRPWVMVATAFQVVEKDWGLEMAIPVYARMRRQYA